MAGVLITVVQLDTPLQLLRTSVVGAPTLFQQTLYLSAPATTIVQVTVKNVEVMACTGTFFSVP